MRCFQCIYLILKYGVLSGSQTIIRVVIHRGSFEVEGKSNVSHVIRKTTLTFIFNMATKLVQLIIFSSICLNVTGTANQNRDFTKPLIIIKERDIYNMDVQTFWLPGLH